MRTRIAGGLFPATLRVPGRVTTLKKKWPGAFPATWLNPKVYKSFVTDAAYSSAFGVPESGSLSFALFAHHVPASEQLPPAIKTTKMMIAIKPSMTYLPSTATVPTEIL